METIPITDVTHRPRGSMCIVCATEECPAPPEFPCMHPIGRDKDGTVVVRCEGFSRK